MAEQNEKDLQTTPASEAEQADKTNAIDYQEQFLRVSADLVNYKRRTEKERPIWRRMGEELILTAVIDVLDDLDRAVSAGNSDKEDARDDTWFDGLLLVQKNLAKKFEQLDVKTIDCSSTFDPSLHEALAQVDSSDHESGQIVEVIKQGYTFKGDVIRHAQVCVAK